MYRIEDIDNIKKNISNIQDQAHYVFKTNYEPTLSEYKEVMDCILEFIKNKKRIIYGGYAQNQLIKIKNENDIFYKEIDTPDVEFYSYEPIKDIIDLCDFLYEKKKFKFIQGSEGVHEGTYKLFVNFENYCDISYISKNICDSMKFIEVKGIRYAHPNFMYIDNYRIFTDPFSFSFRLDKTFNRYLRLYKHYPIEKPRSLILNIKKTPKEDLDIIRKKIIHNSKFIVIGKYAYNYYMSKLNIEPINIDYYEIITIDFEKNIQEIYKKLLKYFKKITTKEYTPFFEFFGKKVEFYINDNLILKVYDNNNRCIVNRFSDKKKCFFGTNQLVILFLLSNYNYAIINKNSLDEQNNLIMLYQIITTKNKYLDLKGKTVLDKTPFEDFIINCNGIALDPRREAFLERINKKKKGVRLNFKYEPSGKKITPPNYIFNNTSGNEIINAKNLILKKY
jgi:hypothetical protein